MNTMKPRGILIGMIISVCLWVLVLGTVYICWGETKYNPMENRWETTDQGDTLKYNPMENEWGYEDPDSQIEYNPHENTWDYAEPDRYGEED